jgi:hypothetical protein
MSQFVISSLAPGIPERVCICDIDFAALDVVLPHRVQGHLRIVIPVTEYD